MTGSARRRSLRLIVLTDDGNEALHEFEANIVSIGRSADNHLAINDPNSSRYHCELHLTRDGVEVIDRDSRNGTFINGLRVHRSAIAPGEAVEIGTTFIYLEHRAENRQSATIAAVTRAQPSVPPQGPRNRPSSRRLIVQDPSQIHSLPELRSYYEFELAELRRVIDLNQTLNSELVLKSILERVLDTVISVAGAERGFVLLNDGDAGRATIVVSRNMDGEDLRDAKDKVSRSITKEVLESGQALLLGDAAQDPRFGGRESILQLNLRSVLSVPLRHKEKILGAITIDNRFESGAFTKRSLERVEMLAAQAAIAIANAQLFAENSRQREELAQARDELLRLNELLRDRLERQQQLIDDAQDELARREQARPLQGDYSAIVTSSPAMHEVLALVDKVRESDVAVLIQGESGTGKDLVARAIHSNSARSQGRFVSENCAAIPPALMESEFFGHVKGAFTGAIEDKPGLFELADGGTLFLDEVGDMDLDIQTKLLRVLQDGVVRRLGAKDYKKVDVRIVSATNRDLDRMIREGRFREDLYYRLNVLNLRLPPLRKRREDIPLLIEHFRGRYANRRGQEAAKFSAEAMALLRSYDWPGNIRELENEMARALALADGEVQAAELSPRLRERVQRKASSLDGLTLSGINLKDYVAREVERLERELVTEALRSTDFNKSAAARLLGISRPTLDSKIERYEINREAIEADSGEP